MNGFKLKKIAILVTRYQMKHSASSNDSSILEPPAFARDDSRMDYAAPFHNLQKKTRIYQKNMR